jgi:hypothetical protein
LLIYLFQCLASCESLWMDMGIYDKSSELHRWFLSLPSGLILSRLFFETNWRAVWATRTTHSPIGLSPS